MSQKGDQHTRNETRNPERKLRKPSQPTSCPRCGLVVKGGRWMKGIAGERDDQKLCPACERVEAENPAGFVYLGGDFFSQNSAEIMNRVQNLVDSHEAEHPVSRIMKQERAPEGILVTTTDMRLARAIGEAIHHAYQGTIEYHHGGGKGGEPITVTWNR